MTAPIPNPWLDFAAAILPHAAKTGAAADLPRSAAPVDITAARTDELQTVGATVSVRGNAIAESSMTMEAPDEAPAAIENPEDCRDFDWDPDGIDNIGEIFFHASKLIADDYRDWALTQADDDLYEQLKREDQANTRDIPIPDRRALEEELMPLFLRRTA